MTVTIRHTTPADGTFSTTGAAAWDAIHQVTSAVATQIIYGGPGGDLAQSASLTWTESTNTLSVSTAQLTDFGTTASNLFQIGFPDSPGSQAGYSLSLIAGNSGPTGANGGNVFINSGYGSSVAGFISVAAGQANTAGDGGAVFLTAGDGVGTGHGGGSLKFVAGNADTNGTGGFVTVSSGSGLGSGAGGDIRIVSGLGGGAGGAVNIAAGDSGASGAGGNVSILAGLGASTGVGGSINVSAGGGGASGGNGGVVNIFSGNGASGGSANGGDINVNCGISGTSGAGGRLYLLAGAGVIAGGDATLQAAPADNGIGGWAYINAGDAHGNAGGEAGSIQLTAGSALAVSTNVGGSVLLYVGTGSAGGANGLVGFFQNGGGNYGVSNGTSAVLVTNKGPNLTTSTIQQWLPVNVDGTTYYIPMWR